MSAELSRAVGLLLSDDLMFTSRITATARQLGLEFLAANTQATLERLAERQAPRCVILDLSNPGLEVAGLLRRLRETCQPAPFVVGYGSHVDTATLRAAREAGCDLVLPRSKFGEELPRALPEWFAAGQSSGGRSAPQGELMVDDGVLHIAEIMDEAGRVVARYSRYLAPDGSNWVRHGLYVAYHPNGQVAGQVTYEHGLEEGLGRDYYDDGQLAAEGHYRAGKEEGVWRFWARDGTEHEPVRYVAGEEV
jgi:CheY-like chemotaxis protein